MHEINAAVYPQGASAYDGSGDPVLPTWLNGAIVGEQEQASSACNYEGWNGHPGISGCRVAYYDSDGDGTFTETLLSNLGTQNQSLILYNGQLAVAGANHNYFDAVDKNLHIWLFSPGAAPMPTPSTTLSGSFVALIGGDVVNSSYVIDGGFFKAADGYPPAAESYIDNQPNPYQQFIFAPSGSNYTICNVQNGACLTDGGNLLDIGQGIDTWAEVPFGSGWSLQDTRTGQYMGAIPSTLGGNIPMSSTPVSLSIGILMPSPATPSPLPTPAGTPTAMQSAIPAPTATATGSFVALDRRRRR